MSLAISVELIHGTIRAASADDVALTGSAPGVGEWPPSPARLFAALVAADGTGARQRVTDGRELADLEQAPPPRILADPLARVTMSPQRDRYVVVDVLHIDPKSRQTGAVQEYPARRAELVRPGTRLCPATPSVIYIWDGLELPAESIRGLELRAARIGYLGCADAPVRVRVHASWSAEGQERGWEPEAHGTAILPVPFPGLLDLLDDAYERWCAGESRRRAWLRTEFARYRAPDDAPEPEVPPVVLWLRLHPPVSGRRVLAVTETLRAALLEGYERYVTGSREAVPAVLHGHGFTGRGYQHAHWLALPEVGYRHAKGRIHGAAIWLPPDTPSEVVEGIRTVLWRLTTLARPGQFHTSIRPFGGETRPWTAHPARWSRPSRHWVSAFPVIHERWQSKGPDLPEVARWCRNAGIVSRPVDVRLSRVPLIEGAVSLRPHEVARSGRASHPYSHVEILFAEPVKGPVVLGQARQFGLGLMAPMRSALPNADAARA